MSEPIEVNFPEDLPCEDWIGTPAEKPDCPMKNWRDGECIMCGECGHEIWYNRNQEEKPE